MKLHCFKLFCMILILTSCNNITIAKEPQSKSDAQIEVEEIDLLKIKADSALAFCKRKAMNTDFCILVDMSIHSGRNRFFVWDFKEQKVVKESLCAHGYGKGSTKDEPVFSNIEGSYCTSLGRYKIGARAASQWGIKVHYKMHGLDKTNNNAFKRWVVLHSHTPVPATEIYPQHMPLGWSQGCPVIDDSVMTYLDTEFKKVKKPVLLWIYK